MKRMKRALVGEIRVGILVEEQERQRKKGLLLRVLRARDVNSVLSIFVVY